MKIPPILTRQTRHTCSYDSRREALHIGVALSSRNTVSGAEPIGATNPTLLAPTCDNNPRDYLLDTGGTVTMTVAFVPKGGEVPQAYQTTATAAHLAPAAHFAAGGGGFGGGAPLAVATALDASGNPIPVSRPAPTAPHAAQHYAAKPVSDSNPFA